MRVAAGKKPRPGKVEDAAIKVSYQPGAVGWAGVYWQYPADNWGSRPGVWSILGEVVTWPVLVVEDLAYFAIRVAGETTLAAWAQVEETVLNYTLGSWLAPPP